MCLRFVFLLITRVASWLQLSRHQEARQTAEIILRHQLAVLQRQHPRRPDLNWADQALLGCLSTLLSVIPKAGGARGCGCWSPLQTRSCAGTATSPAAAGPPDPSGAGPAARPPAGTSRSWFSG